MTQGTRVQNALDDVTGNGSGKYSSPRHRMQFNSRNEGSKCVGRHGLEDIARHVISSSFNSRNEDSKCVGRRGGQRESARDASACIRGHQAFALARVLDDVADNYICQVLA